MKGVHKMSDNVKCPFCGGNMIETRCFGFKESEEVTEEMFEKYESGELEPIFYTLICDECGAQSPQCDTEGEAVAFMRGFNERIQELS